MKRLIYNDLLNWKNEKSRKPLMVYGARQVGKSYIIEEFCKNEYKNYIKIDMNKNKKIRDLFALDIDFEDKYEQFKILLENVIDIEDSNSIIFFDEIQKSKELIEDLKYFCEDHNNVNVICAGSLLGTMLSRTKHFSPVGKVWELNMYPMTFEEFLIALDREQLVTRIKDCYEKNKKIGDLLHLELLKLYKTYLYIGGMPESIQNYINNECKLSEYSNDILSSIINKYYEDMNQYVESSSEMLRIKEIYDNIGSQLGNTSNKFQPSKIDKNKRMDDYVSAINWLYTSKLVLRCFSLKEIEEPLKVYGDEKNFKLYLSDCGLLSNLVKFHKKYVFDDTNMIYKGIIAENYVASELIHNGLDLYYWTSGNEAEIDFVIGTNDGIIPIEVKSCNNRQSKSLKIYMDKYNPLYGIRASMGDFSYDSRTKIKDIPLYALFCIKK